MNHTSKQTNHTSKQTKRALIVLGITAVLLIALYNLTAEHQYNKCIENKGEQCEKIKQAGAGE